MANKTYRYRILTEFGWDFVPCEILDKPDENHYHIEYFDNVKGRLEWDTVPISSVE